MTTYVQPSEAPWWFAKAVYVFGNPRRDRVKILPWDRNGYWPLLKRLEQDRFIWPDEAWGANADARAVALATRRH